MYSTLWLGLRKPLELIERPLLKDLDIYKCWKVYGISKVGRLEERIKVHLCFLALKTRNHSFVSGSFQICIEHFVPWPEIKEPLVST